jgi:hypothetical protein
MPYICFAARAQLKPTAGLMDGEDELRSRRRQHNTNKRGDKDMYQVKLSLERYIKRATLQHKLVCITIDRMERELRDVRCSGELCDAEESWKPWSPNQSWMADDE